ncbi:MAG: UDP-N-acetylmuramoyl-L-alanine--D-glutamate ligase [Deltaproteobacteria bacterium]|nr:UDP-N-acetylmuramoyl-L-alanine--D-glutamate ligase [Deltaproteobacteria bacterium]
MDGVFKKKLQYLIGKRAFVVGLGVTGSSVAAFLAENGMKVSAADDKPREKLKAVDELERLGVKVETGGIPKKCFEDAEFIVVSPGVDARGGAYEEARRRGVEVVSDIELASRMIEEPVVAITGTNGKSTVTTLVSLALEKSGKKVFTGGNIGNPVMKYFERPEGGYDACVLEISSFHLENVKEFRPRVAVMLNITEDHLDRYSGFDEYARVKFEVFKKQGPSDFAVVNAGDAVSVRMLRETKMGAEVVRYSVKEELKEGVFLKGAEIVFRRGGVEEKYPTAGIKLAGLHNIENIMAVIAASRVSGARKEAVMEAIYQFGGLPHRMEFVRELNGVKYYNDSKGTNVGSLYSALSGFAANGTPRLIVIAGGKDKGGDYGVLKETIKGRVKLMVVIGEAKEKIIDALGRSTDMIRADGIEEAVIIAFANAKRGDTVLLCPACSSFDMFKNYEERGMIFRRLVEEL